MPRNNLGTVRSCEFGAKLLKMATLLIMALELAVSSQPFVVQTFGTTLNVQTYYI